MLEARAGEPNWGPEILARHASIDSLDSARRLLPRLGALGRRHLREPHELPGARLRALGPADAQLARRHDLGDGRGGAAPRARAATRAELGAHGAAHGLRLPARHRDDAAHRRSTPTRCPTIRSTLTYDEFLVAVARLERAGYPMERTPEEAWPHFRGWRVNYESIAYELADRIDAVPAPWTGARHRGGLTSSSRARRSTGCPAAATDRWDRRDARVTTSTGWGPALAAFVVILPAELPDKTFVATLVLATRFRPLAVWIGVTARVRRAVRRRRHGRRAARAAAAHRSCCSRRRRCSRSARS